jgi:hypothetical protein
MTVDEKTLIDTNQRYLAAALADVRTALERYIACMRNNTTLAETASKAQPEGEDIDQQHTHTALEALCATFGLSSFERAIVLLCAGMELQTSFATLCADAQGEPARPYPTFGLALAALDQPHWSALAPDRPLRRWRLIEVTRQPGTLVTASPLHIDERVLHFLVGVQHLDERLTDLIEPVQADSDLVPSHMALARRIETIWVNANGYLPLIQLCGNDETSKQAIAAACCARTGLHLFRLPADSIPANPNELAGLARLWEREAALTSSALYVGAEAIDAADTRGVMTVMRLLERTNSPLLLQQCAEGLNDVIE